MKQGFVLILFAFPAVLLTGCNGLQNIEYSVDGQFISGHDFIQLKHEIDSVVRGIEEAHSIDVCYMKRPVFSWWTYKYSLAPKSDYATVLEYLKLLQIELNKYPEGFLRKAGLKNIVVCRKMSILGDSVCAFADTVHKTVYLNYSGSKYAVEPGQKMVIHHELYHVIEAKFNGNSLYKEPVWIGFNDVEFKYEEAGLVCGSNESDQGIRYHPEKGFVTHGARSAAWQDKAEVYAALLVEEMNSCLYDWMKEDEILRNKVNYMKEFLFKCFDEMTQDFWENLSTGLCTMPLELGGSLEETADSRFSAVLDEDSSVELVAVTKDANGIRKWWKPNGEQFEEPPFGIIEKNAIGDVEVIKYQFFFRIKSDRRFRHFYDRWKLLETEYIDQIESGSVIKNGWYCPNVHTVTCYLPEKKQSCSMAVGLAVGKWITKVIYNPITNRSSPAYQGVVFSKPYMKKGKLEIKVPRDIVNLSHMAVALVAVDLAGMDHRAIDINTRVVEGKFQMSYRFNLDLAKVKDFQLRTCPYRWITFENVSLIAGHETDIQIITENN